MGILPLFRGQVLISQVCSVDEYYENMKALGKEIQPIDKEAMLNYVQKSGGQIIAKKGATFYACNRMQAGSIWYWQHLILLPLFLP